MIELLSDDLSKDSRERGLVYFDGARYQCPTKVLVLGVPEWWRETQFNTGGSCISHNLINMLSTQCLGLNQFVSKEKCLVLLLESVCQAIDKIIES